MPTDRSGMPSFRSSAIHTGANTMPYHCVPLCLGTLILFHDELHWFPRFFLKFYIWYRSITCLTLLRHWFVFFWLHFFLSRRRLFPCSTTLTASFANSHVSHIRPIPYHFSMGLFDFHAVSRLFQPDAWLPPFHVLMSILMIFWMPAIFILPLTRKWFLYYILNLSTAP